ncbi:hypothetical protein A1O7_03388 [Cladophialophora yegresii CBS 114405]|uniref:Uncharacterized protein n=1 Tax=Cladophialophora yegresii CBS 114405 TaxID=1182544 RepID=W9WXF7_9EURO|nr:uncharacterized protein A1O7_03388 [Cladophialophora yegresii CBS 114405]EXJ62944.1 hypothetical protein A1O7_03388 [Cladophialophora yegresii CBS 114405]
MPARKSGASKKATSVATKSHKRQLSESTPIATPGSRASKRIKESAEKERRTSNVIPTKSKYFHKLDSEDDDVGDDRDDESGYEDEDASAPEELSSDDSLDEDDDDSEQEVRERKTKSKKASKGAGGLGAVVSAVMKKGKELWRPGVRTGLGPGKQVFIEKPKPRGNGGVKYLPGTIHPNTMAFLKDLKANNDREWLKMHDPDYRQSWKDWESFVEALTEKITAIDETIPELPPKDLVFRIYRDIRFSSDPTPYKPHFSAAWSRTGRKGPYACYYVQVQPGGRSFVGSGLWMPDAQPLALLRQNIDRRPKKLRQILTEPQMRKRILEVSSNDEKKAIKAFADQNKENALKTKPKVCVSLHPPLFLNAVSCLVCAGL